jgi:glycosyltransferase involved in cell wall biosynthesis
MGQQRVKLKRRQKNGKKIYSIYDVYAHADVITFPSEIEGFGNPVLEACAYKKPLFVNKFPVFNEIATHGFDFVVMDQKLDEKTVKKMYQILTNKKKRKIMVDKNYWIAKQHYSQHTLECMLSQFLIKHKEGGKEVCTASLPDTEKQTTMSKGSSKVNKKVS